MDLDNASYRQLQQECIRFNLKPCNVKNSVLRDKLKNYNNKSNLSVSSVDIIDYNMMTVKKLKELLDSMNQRKQEIKHNLLADSGNMIQRKGTKVRPWSVSKMLTKLSCRIFPMNNFMHCV